MNSTTLLDHFSALKDPRQVLEGCLPTSGGLTDHLVRHDGEDGRLCRGRPLGKGKAHFSTPGIAIQPRRPLARYAYEYRKSVASVT